MKGEKIIIAGILIAGAVALFAAGASAKGGSSSSTPPDTWHPELTDARERQFVWAELQARSGADIAAHAQEYSGTVLEGTPLSTLALAILEGEAIKKIGAGK